MTTVKVSVKNIPIVTPKVYSNPVAEVKKGDSGRDAYDYAVLGGWLGSREEFATEMFNAVHSVGQSETNAAITVTKASDADNSAYLAAQSAIAAGKTKSERDTVACNPAMVLQKDVSVYMMAISANSTITFDTSQLTNGKAWHFMVELSMPAVKTLTWPANIYWFGGSDFSRIGTYNYMFYSNDNGLHWMAYRLFENTQYVNLLTNKIVYVDAAKADDTGNGLTWATAKKNVQAGIDLAIAGDIVYVKAGTYLPTTERTPGSARSKSFILKNGVHLYGGFQGTETSPAERVMTRTTEILPLPYGDYTLNIDLPTYQTILSGDLDGNSVDGGQSVNYIGNRLNNITNNASLVVNGSGISQFTVFNGFQISGSNGSGGILMTSTLAVSNCDIFSNYSTGNGAGASGSGSISQSIIRNNYASGSGGGVEYIGLINCILKYNSCGAFGGGSYSSYIGSCLVSYNQGDRGSGLCYGSSYNSWFTRNVHSGSSPTLFGTDGRNLLINFNSGTNSYSSPTGGTQDGTLVNCIISNNEGNSALSGGGTGGVSGGTLTNCLIANNYGKSLGGASGATLINCTVVKNRSNGPAGVNSCTLKNTVVWGNRTGIILHNITGGSANYCAFENEVIAGTANVNLNATNDVAGGPYFVNPSPNAGLTEAATDYDIGASSALINVGNNTYLTTGEGATYDLKHRTRKVGTIDIGAFEKQA